MTYRDDKQFGPDEYFHVYNRGNSKMDIFLDEQDYRNFLKRLGIVLGKEHMSKMPFDKPVSKHPSSERIRLTSFDADDFSLVCYCLMPNHFHLCIKQNKDIPIGAILLRVCSSYAKYFNRKYDHTGHVFQDQFSAVHIATDSQFVALSAYIHQNPKVAGLVRKLKMWQHSSYNDYVVGRKDTLCKLSLLLDMFKSQKDYEEFVEERYQDILERKGVQFELFD